MEIREDNEACIKVCNKGYSAKLRHIIRTHRVDLSSIKECLDEQPITLTYVKTDAQAADIFTKALPPNKWPRAVEMLNISPKGLAEPKVSGCISSVTEFAPPVRSIVK